MDAKTVTLGGCSFELLTEEDRFLGLGKVMIDGTQVRSGRLPLSLRIDTFTGVTLARQELLGVDESPDEVRIRTRAVFVPLETKLMRDHSFDPVFEVGDWDAERAEGSAELDLVLRPAEDAFGGVAFAGFSYHYDYRSEDTPIFWMLDRASWELGGDIAGATAVSQSSCSDPVATFGAETEWTTEGVMHWARDEPGVNTVMTHNLPRWASHQAFDFQYKGDRTLAGVFERVDLIRTLLRREPGKAELKVFDKHIFDETTAVRTTPKRILLNTEPKSAIGQQNVWTWMIEEVHTRARAEHGLAEEPLVPFISQNYWRNYNYDSYFKDLIPAARNIGAQAVFIDNVNKSAMTEECPHPGVFNWNMCCGHEYEPAPRLGGPEKLKELIDRTQTDGIHVFSWTNNDQALSSPLNSEERDDEKQWYVKMECARLKYGGAYTNVFSIWDFKSEGARRNWIDSLKAIRESTGLNAYLFDSFYNLGFMPVNYSHCRPTTQWKECLDALRELQEADIHFHIESMGPFGMVMHGCPTSYNIENMFACYKVNLGSGYTTVPGKQKLKQTLPNESARLYYVLAHMTNPGIPLFLEGKRIDTLWADEHRRALADYNEHYGEMHHRILQEDGKAVIWHNRAGTRATVWNFADRTAALPGTVRDLTTGKALPPAKTYALQAQHTYAVEANPLPAALGDA